MAGPPCTIDLEPCHVWHDLSHTSSHWSHPSWCNGYHLNRRTCRARVRASSSDNRISPCGSSAAGPCCWLATSAPGPGWPPCPACCSFSFCSCAVHGPAAFGDPDHRHCHGLSNKLERGEGRAPSSSAAARTSAAARAPPQSWAPSPLPEPRQACTVAGQHPHQLIGHAVTDAWSREGGRRGRHPGPGLVRPPLQLRGRRRPALCCAAALRCGGGAPGVRRRQSRPSRPSRRGRPSRLSGGRQWRLQAGGVGRRALQGGGAP